MIAYNIFDQKHLIETLKNKDITGISIHYKIELLDSLEGSTHLENLFICNNILKYIRSLDPLINLTVLHVHGNNLQSIPSLDKFINLLDLSVGYNQLSQLPNIDNLVNLETMFISDNKLLQLPEHLTVIPRVYSGQNNFPEWLNYRHLIGRY